MVLWMLCSVSGFVVVSTIGIILPEISEELDLSPGEQGVLSSAAFWGNLALAIPLPGRVYSIADTAVVLERARLGILAHPDTVPFQLPGISARETAVAIAFIMTMVSAGTVTGPLIAGFVEEAMGDLEMGLLIASFPALLLAGAGVFLRLNSEGSVAQTARKRLKNRPGV